MNLSTIFSKTGKGLQETSGKTSHLSRADRSVLTAIDGKLTVAELARRVGKTSDMKFQQLVEKLESQGFIREVAPAPSAVSAPRPPSVITHRPPASKPAGESGGSDDLDFTQAFALPKRPAAPSKPIDLAAKVHETTAAPGGAAFDYRARAEAEARAKSEVEKKTKVEADARAKARAEAKAKAEAEAKAREADQAKAWTRELAEAEAKAARDAIARAEAEEARARKEAEDKKRREEEERKAKAEAERKAKVEAELRAKEEAERARREEEERKAREEAERKAKIEAERRAKEEAERRAKEEAERKRREEEERKRREEDERRQKEAQERARREEEARRRKEEEERRRREDVERKRLEAEERQRREAEERARREEEERQRKEEEERKAQEEAERKRLDAEERARREEEERRSRKEEERRKRREEEDRRRTEEDERRRREDEEIRLREEEAREVEERPIREAEERQRREEDLRRAEEDERRRIEDEARELEDRKRREEEALRAKEEALRRKEEELERKEAEIRRAEEQRTRREREQEEARAKPSGDSFDRLLDDLDFVDKKDDVEPPVKREREVAAKPSGGSFAERLLADLDLFGKKDDEEDRRKEEEARRAKEDAMARKAREKDEKRRREDEARRAKQEAKAREQAERQSRKDEERRAREEAERNAQEEAERQVREDHERKEREKAERRAREKLERRRKAAAPEKPVPETDDVVITDDDLGMDDVRRDEALLTPEAREAARERAREVRRREKEGAGFAPPPRIRRPIKWGRPLAITLLAGLAVGLVAIHVVPIAQEPYERLASRTLGQPVRIGSAHLSLVNGLELRFENVRVGDIFQAQVVRAAPELDWLLGENTGFRRVDIGQGMLAQGSLAQLLLGNLAEGGMRVQRVSATGLRIEGPVPLPALDVDLQLTANGTLRFGTLSGADNLQVKIARLGSDITIEASADRLSVPVLPGLMLGDFSMKAAANANGMNIAEWDGRLYDGVVRGNARVQWRNGWNVQGEMRIVEMNAGVFAPAMLSAGKVEANGRFALGGPNPAKLGASARLEGRLAIRKGVLGSVDLSRAIQSGGRHVVGRTQFNDLSADAVYDRGAVAVRNMVISAGALSGGGRIDISADGRLGGRIVAEVKTPSQQLRSVLELSGTAREPQASASN